MLESQDPIIPQEFPELPVVAGALQPVGRVVRFAIPEELPVRLPYVPTAVDTLDAVETALKGPLLMVVLAV